MKPLEKLDLEQMRLCTDEYKEAQMVRKINQLVERANVMTELIDPELTGAEKKAEGNGD